MQDEVFTVGIVIHAYTLLYTYSSFGEYFYLIHARKTQEGYEAFKVALAAVLDVFNDTAKKALLKKEHDRLFNSPLKRNQAYYASLRRPLKNMSAVRKRFKICFRLKEIGRLLRQYCLNEIWVLYPFSSHHSCCMNSVLPANAYMFCTYQYGYG